MARSLAIRGLAAVGLGLVSLALGGCVNTQSWVLPAKHAPQPAAPAVAEVSTVWSGLAVTQDSVNGGRPLPGIAGRMYLMGPDLGVPVLCDGTVVVDMLTPGADGKMQMRERWEIDPATLKRLVKKDVIGQGYTLFLPWGSFAPDVTQAQMRVAFVPSHSKTPIYGSPSMVNIRPPQPIPIEERVFTPPPKQ